MDKDKPKPKRKKRVLLCLLFVAAAIVMTVVIYRIFDNSFVSYREFGNSESEIVDFFLANEEKFQYIIARIRETNYTGSWLQIRITKRTKDVVLSTDRFKTYTSSEDLGITLDDEFVEYLSLILIDSRLGCVTVSKYPKKFIVSFKNQTSSGERGIIYYDDEHDELANDRPENWIKDNWYYG